MLIPEGGAAGGDRGGDPGQMHRHHVGVTLDHDSLMTLGDIALGQVDAEEHRRLLIEHCFRGVDVLGGDLVVIEDAPRAETYRLATGAANGPQ